MPLNIFNSLKGVFRGLGRFLGRTGQDAASYAFGTATGEAMSPFFREFRYSLNRKIPTERLTVSEITQLYRRGLISRNEFLESLEEHGLNRERAEQIEKLSVRLLDITEVRDMYLRGLISEEEHDRRLSSLGLSKEDTDIVKELYFYIPSPPDLVRMAVRDAWRDDIAEKYGYDEDFPEEFAEWAKKQGMSETWAKYYWRSHWELPSPTMAYEMLHRGIISREELETLLKIADYPKFWREKLIQLSYTPFTRVDVRRMYQTGVLDREGVFKAYKDLGYDDEKAEKLTQFTIAGATEEERDLTRADITGGYHDKILDRNEAKEMLIKLGYDEEEAEFYLLRVDYDAEKEKKKQILSYVKKRYLAEVIDDNKVIEILSAENFLAKEIEQQLEMWRLERKEKVSQPTRTELQTFFKRGVINEQEFRDELRKHGYSDKYIEWYVKYARMGGTAT